MLKFSDVSPCNTGEKITCYKQKTSQNAMEDIYICICNTVTHVTLYIRSRAQDHFSPPLQLVKLLIFLIFILLIPVLRCYLCYNVDNQCVIGVTARVTHVLQRSGES